MKKAAVLAVLALLFLFPAIARAQVTAAIIPFDGDDSSVQSAEKTFTQNLIRGRQIQIVSERAMKDILAIHERAQLQGSGLHDISKLKLAEFIISGNLTKGTLTVSAVDVNTSIIVFSKGRSVNNGQADYALRALSSECRDAIIASLSGSSREAPDAAKPYLAVLGSLVQSLGSPDEASFPFLAVYSRGTYIHPASDVKSSFAKGKQFLKYFRPYFIRGKITFLAMEKKSGNVMITCIVDKAGSTTKHVVGFVELEDGTIAILDELHKIIQ